MLAAAAAEQVLLQLLLVLVDLGEEVLAVLMLQLVLLHLQLLLVQTMVLAAVVAVGALVFRDQIC